MRVHCTKMCWVGEICKAFSCIFLAVVSRRTAFNIDWLFLNTLHTLHGNETFNSLSTAYNDYFNDRYTNGKAGWLYCMHCSVHVYCIVLQL